MNLLYKTILLFLLATVVIAQTKLEQEIEKLQRNESVKYEYLPNNKLAVTHSDYKTAVFNLGNSNNSYKENTDSIPRFVYYLDELDTSLFNYKYKFWREMPIGTSFGFTPLIGDINNNSREEMYAAKNNNFDNPPGIFCYEFNQWGWFKQNYHYKDNALFPFNIYDIDRDGEPEIHLVLTRRDTISGYIIKDHTFYKKNAPDSLATQFYFDYNIYTGGGLDLQLDDFTFGDFDKDGTTDAIFISFLNSMNIVSFNKEEKTFDSVLTYSTYLDSITGYEYMHGFIIDDMDMDGETDIIYTGEENNIYMLENGDSSEYSISWQGKASIENNWILFKTNDIDGNGKPELWVGGETFPQPKTRLTCYEMTSNNTFKSIVELEFPNIVTLGLFRGTAMDIDRDTDRKEELVIAVGNTVAIMKFTGSTDNHLYEVYYKKKYDESFDELTSIDVYKFNSQVYPSIVACFNRHNTGGLRETKIYNHYLTTAVAEETIIKPGNFKLYQNYPNPFNPSTNIDFVVSKQSRVSIRIFNTLGEEIKTIINKTLLSGEHHLHWNGLNKNNNPVPSGIYFITLEAGSFRKTIKSVLIK